MYNYSDLSDIEFEYLACDIMEKRLGVKLHRFSKGRDGGIDLTDDCKDKTIIVQIKHYIKTPFSGLLTALKKEVLNVKKINPRQYYVVCSCELTPNNTEQIYDLFREHMTSTHNVLSIVDIDAFLNQEENKDIVNRHYKLWLCATNVLSDMISQSIFIDSQVLLFKIKSQKEQFVETESYRKAIDYLSKKRVLLLIGPPGVGKTITSEMIVLHFAAKGYKVRYTTDGENLNILKNALSVQPKLAEVILLDDCLGQSYFKMKETQENELLSLIRYVFMSENKVLLLNSRVTIYNEARDKSRDFYKEIENGDLKVQTIDMSCVTLIEKARIFYNHLYFSGLSHEYFENIKHDKNYLRIISHKNYSPRIIEYVTIKSIQCKVEAASYYTHIKNMLDSPNDIWFNEYNYRLQAADRILITTLFSLTDTIIELGMLRNCFCRRLLLIDSIDRTVDNWNMSINRLNESFLSVFIDKGTEKVGVINASVNDFLGTLISNSTTEKAELVKSIVSVKQMYRLLDNAYATERAKQLVLSGKILDYEFESQKNMHDFIIISICLYDIKRNEYQDIVFQYIMESHDINCPLLCAKSKEEIISTLLQPVMCEFYNVRHLLVSDYAIRNLLADNQLDILIDLLNILESLFPISSITRNEYIKLVEPYLRNSIELYVTGVDAASASDNIDINAVLENNTDRSYDTNGCGLDEDAAIEELEEIIRTDIESELYNIISTLPRDISSMIDLTKDYSISVAGARSVIHSYLTPDYDIEYERHGIAESSSNSEIDYMFDR